MRGPPSPHQMDQLRAGARGSIRHLSLERELHTQRFFFQLPAAVSQLAHRQRALMVTLPLPLQTSDLTQGSSNAVAECISRGPPQLLEAFAARLLQRSPRAAAALRGEWIENYQLRCTVRQQIQPRKNPTHLTREGTDAAAFALLANQLAAAHVGSFPFSLTSEASHVGMSAWFVSALVYNWLGNVNGQ